MTPIEIIDKALADSVRLSARYPKFQPLESTIVQLQYLKGVLDKKIQDRSRLKEIILGVYAAREFEDHDMDFANILYEVETIVDQLKCSKL